MTVNRIAFRYQAEGGDQVVAEGKRLETALVGAQTAATSATERAIASADRQIAKLRETAATAEATTATQRRIDALVGVTGGTNARASVAARSLMAQDDAQDRRAAEVLAVLNPLGAAQARYNAELAEYAALARAGKISTDQLAQANAMARTRMDEATAAADRQGRGLTRLAVASRLNLARQGADVAVTAAMGMNPAMIAMQQGPQILDAMATSGIRLTGTMVGLGVAAGVTAGAVLALGAAWHSGEAASLDLDRAVSGLGRTSGLTSRDLEALTISAAEQGRVSVSSAREQAIAYLNTGRIGGEQIAGLIAIGRDYASVMGLDAEKATQSLAQAMLAPDKAGRDLTRTMGLLDQATLDQIDSMVKQGDLMGAQTLLIAGLDKALKGHADQLGQVETAWQAISRGISDAWHNLGTYLHLTEDEKYGQLIDARVRVERRGGPQTPAERTAYDEWGRQAWEIQQRRTTREAQRSQASENQAAQAAADARARAMSGRRSGSSSIDRDDALVRARRDEDRAASIEMEVARVRQDVATQRRLEDANAVRQRTRELEDSGLATEVARSRALEEQAPLIAARREAAERETIALGDQAALQRMRDEGNYRAVADLEAAAEKTALIARYQALVLDHAEATRLAETDLLYLATGRADAAERLAVSAERERQISLAMARGDRTTADRLGRDSWIESRAREIERSGNLNQGEGDDQAAREWAETWSAEAQGARRDWVQGFVADIRRGGISDALAEQLNRATDRMIEGLVDKLFDLDWSGLLGSAGNNGVGAAGTWFSRGLEALLGIGRNADGTDYWRGGYSLVGERGPELVDMPRGARVMDAERTRRVLGGGGGGTVVNHYYLQGAVTTDELWTRIDRGDRMAAQAGAQQGARTGVGIVRATAAREQHAQRMMK